MKIFLDALSRIPTVSIGTQALILGSMQIIKKFYNNVQFVMLSAFPEVEKTYCYGEGRYDVKIVKRSRFQLGTLFNIRSILKNVDAVVSSWGDGYITVPPYKIFQKTMFLKTKNKPLILFTSSIGPFTDGVKQYFAKKGLEKFDKLTVRDTVTFSYLEKLGIENIVMIPDTAFVLEPAGKIRIKQILTKENVTRNRKYLGVNISILLMHRFKNILNLDYSMFMAEIIEYLSQKYKTHILLIPHQIYPNCLKTSEKILSSYDGDDRYAIKEVMKKIKDKSVVSPIMGEYGPNEYKGVISNCDFFIGGRMHSVIGAISEGVPSVIMQYSHKAFGVMDMIGLKQYVWDIKSPKEDLIKTINTAWHLRETLRTDIKNRMLNIKKEAYKAGEALVNALNAK